MLALAGEINEDISEPKKNNTDFMSKTTLQNILFIIICVMILYYVNKSYKADQYLKSNYDFTIGKTLKFTGAGGNKGFISYCYFVSGKKYKGDVRRNRKIDSSIGNFFKVKYSKVNPEISEMYLTEEITDSSEIVKAGFKYKK
ncbi:hypothetical protein [Flavobacterium sp. RSSB_23]|uniref:hypothetical protein n=1 Tax=Flavobacterium sp. RSSB_23 TaxID=3447668 RepID=UPI003F350692